MNGVIDLVGRVVESADSRFKEGDSEVVIGGMLSEVHDSGSSESACLPGKYVIPLPPGLTEYQVKPFGIAGFTAAIAVIRMEDNRQNPSRGPIIVTGAKGGVGSFAISSFSNLGYEIIA